ncbi:hypothetical protein J3R82DRAFT_1582 [Butyriboletus roseoflavus]|nr:hypothetical protein J3R82DRAFT_1582 [Butyriboletus roseoflavus]
MGLPNSRTSRVESLASPGSPRNLGRTNGLHIACHGLPNRRHPFGSTFALHDGHFTIERIIRCELWNPQFAYLSAYHMTVGDEESPDEMMHLASAM